MVHFKLISLQQGKRLVAMIGLATALSGCALDDLTKEETFEPYGGSKQHPIKVANGKASVEKCGDWSENRADTLDNTFAANHGCAVQSNIAAMAANPNDLVRARRMSRAPAVGHMPVSAPAATAAPAPTP
jgi:type IV pilus biogenesis protein CpaD/CtpE